MRWGCRTREFVGTDRSDLHVHGLELGVCRMSSASAPSRWLSGCKKSPFSLGTHRNRPLSDPVTLQKGQCLSSLSDNRTLVIDKASVCRRFWAAALLLSEVGLPLGDGRTSDSFLAEQGWNLIKQRVLWQMQLCMSHAEKGI